MALENRSDYVNKVGQQVVTVIIPSIGRPELKRAIESVRNQITRHSIEIAVVFDLPNDCVPTDITPHELGADYVEFTGGGQKGGAARNLGVSVGSGNWVAYLDDDDYWSDDKIELQMAAAIRLQDGGKVPIVGCRLRQNYEGSTQASPSVPLAIIGIDQPIWNYLFHRRRPGAGRASFPTSTLLLPMSLAQAVPWTEKLSRHQDWDYLVRLAQTKNSIFYQIDDTCVTYNVGSAGSISASSDWKSSLDWAVTVLGGSRVTFSQFTVVEFLAAQTLRYALQARSARGTIQVLAAMARTRQFPSIRSLLVGISGVVGRRNLEKFMSILK